MTVIGPGIDRLTDEGVACNSIPIRSPCSSPRRLPTYWLLRKWRGAQNLLLLGAGYYFYACWNPKFLALLVLSTVVDYACGLWIDRFESRQ